MWLWDRRGGVGARGTDIVDIQSVLMSSCTALNGRVPTTLVCKYYTIQTWKLGESLVQLLE
jgi:hypothetical protein